MPHPAADPTGLEIAVIGLAGRFPGAPDIDTFWANLKAGRETITALDPDVLRARGVPDDTLNAPNFVARGADIDGADTFDAEFFGYAPGEAEILDPQQRIFLECAWHAMENAGYGAGTDTANVAVFAAAGMNGYLLNLYGNAGLRDTVTPYEIFTANDKDFLATRTAFKLNLRGPAVTVQTACSSSLVAVHMAAQSLIAGDCDMALAGGVALSRQDGYRALHGSILSPTGQCRAFSEDADGTVTGNGVGVVVLKRLEDALADKDRIDAVIRGSAINNDGAGKASFTAPDVMAQAQVIDAALLASDVTPDTISYVEAHGTGTALGDPVEVAALTRAFRRGTDARGFCALGSAKTNIGHLDTAAGMAGLIKTVLMLRHRMLVPSLHFGTPNPQIDFASSPFAVNTALRDWTAQGPLRAGVSSFGIGGTNAHVVLEEPPHRPQSPDVHAPQVLTLSARTPTALAASAAQLADHLMATKPALGDVALTLAQGRKDFRWRQCVSAQTVDQAAATLRRLAQPGAPVPPNAVAPVFLCPGQGSQHAGMIAQVYDTAPDCAALLDRAATHLGRDLRDGDLTRTDIAQPALFAAEYALAQFWIARGVTPSALLGHSLGELTAACIAGVFTFEDGLDLVAARGRLMQAAAPGAMVAVVHPDHPLPDIADVEIAARNGPRLTTLTGPVAAITHAVEVLQNAGLGVTQLRTSHGFHSHAMGPAAAEFAQIVAGKTLSAPGIPVLSNVTGTWLTDNDAVDPAYWARQLRDPVAFGDCVETAQTIENPVFIEIGPGATLSNLVAHQSTAPTLPGLPADAPGAAMGAALGQAWALGVPVASAHLAPHDGQRIALPGYPFQRDRYWVTADATPPAAAPDVSPQEPQIYLPNWHRTALPRTTAKTGRRWLVLDDGRVGRALAQTLERGGDDAYRVTQGDTMSEPGYRHFTLPPHQSRDLQTILSALATRGTPISDMVILWPVDDTQTVKSIMQALVAHGQDLRVTLVTTGAADVTGTEDLRPDLARLHGVVQVAGQECPALGCRVIDLDPAEPLTPAGLAPVLRDALVQSDAAMMARRANRFWTLHHSVQNLPDTPDPLRKNGVYAVIGHVAQGIGQVWAAHIPPHARLALIETPDAAPLPIEASDRVLKLTADCGDPTALAAALDQVKTHWGRLDGIFLSTPFSDQASMAPLALSGADQAARVQASCIAPVAALAQITADHPVGFVCLQSSLASAIGGMGLADYAGGHHHTDVAAALYDRTTRTNWIAIGWDMLAGDGTTNDHALSAGDIWALTGRILGAGLTGACTVSRSDVDTRRATWLNTTPQTAASDTTSHARTRPDLETPFVAPRTATETQVAQILGGLLGLDAIGVDDGFFELGGHSLLAIRAIAHLRDTFPVALEMGELLRDNPTAAGIARLIEHKMAADDDLADLLDEVGDLSQSALDALLTEEAL
ncbi:beta-ketoacyl synthase N-terminal-like domain-containing protein [Roseobacter sp.]|uniref:type I polyketide synthase n=1 Tax=Roseobacter sp. TaxID=1907202 RepID=UPI003296A4C3